MQNGPWTAAQNIVLPCDVGDSVQPGSASVVRTPARCRQRRQGRLGGRDAQDGPLDDCSATKRNCLRPKTSACESLGITVSANAGIHTEHAWYGFPPPRERRGIATYSDYAYFTVAS